MINKTVGCIVQARMGSTRLPGKTLIKINGKPILGFVIERLNQCKFLDHIVVATSERKKDNLIEDYCKKNKINYCVYESHKRCKITSWLISLATRY